jgi:hypothetical protein
MSQQLLRAILCPEVFEVHTASFAFHPERPFRAAFTLQGKQSGNSI